MVEESISMESIETFLNEHHAYLVEKTMSQVSALKSEMSRDFEHRAAERDAEHLAVVTKLREDNAELKRQLNLAQHSLTALVGEKESSNWTAATRFLRGKLAVSKKNVFVAWWKQSIHGKAERLLSHVATKRHAKHLESKVLHAWYRHVHGSRTGRFADRANARLKAVTSDIISRYEIELDKLRAIIKAQEEQVLEGRRRRCALEDELRRTLLKGMVTMNLETLSIFSSAAANDPPPPSPQIDNGNVVLGNSHQQSHLQCPVPRSLPEATLKYRHDMMEQFQRQDDIM